MGIAVKWEVAREMLDSVEQAKKYWKFRVSDDPEDAVAKEEYNRLCAVEDFLKGYIKELAEIIPF